MHNEIFPRPEIDVLLREHFYIVQMNMFGDKEVTDFDGTVLSEKKMAVRWGVIFTPTMMFMPDAHPGDTSAGQAAVMVMPGAFDKYTTKNILNFVWLKGYEGDEHFQKFHARELAKAQAAEN
jgi:thioredoxin-related protein